MPAQSQGDGPQCALVAPGKALIFMADGALGIPACGAVARRSLLHILEFRLGQVDGDHHAPGGETRVPIQTGLLDVGVFNAIVVEPVHGGHTTLGPLHLREAPLQLGWPGGQDSHNRICHGGGIILNHKPGALQGLHKGFQEIIDATGSGISRSIPGIVGVQGEKRQDLIASPVDIGRVQVQTGTGVPD